VVLERLVCLVLKVLLEKREKKETADLSVYRVIVDRLDFPALPDFQVFLEHLERKAFPLWDLKVWTDCPDVMDCPVSKVKRATLVLVVLLVTLSTVYPECPVCPD